MASTRVGLLAQSSNIADRLRKGCDRLLTEKAKQAVAYAANLADASIHTDRPASRRNLTKGKKHYINSFVVFTSVNDRKRVRVEITNTSPVAHIIESGSRPHPIEPRNAEALRFPVPTAQRKSTGKQIGRFSMNGPAFVFRDKVRHPGTRSFQILGRTAKAVRSGQVARGTGIRSGK